MNTVTLGGQPYDRREPTAVEEAFYANFCCRRLAVTYGVPLAEITADQRAHVLHDLNAIRYRAWLMLRHNGLTMAQIGQLVTDETAIDVFLELWAEVQVVLTGTAEAIAAQINANRRAVGKPEIKPINEAPANDAQETATT